MKLFQIEKRILQTSTNSKDIIQKDREHARRSSRARSTRGQENEAWAVYKKNPSRVWDSFLYLRKLYWFLYLLVSYFYDHGMFIFLWSSNFVEKVVLKGSMAAKMASRVSYLVYYYFISIDHSLLCIQREI